MAKMTEAEKAAQQVVLDVLLAEDSAGGAFAREAVKILPKGLALQYVAELAKLVGGATDDVVAVEVNGARIAMGRIEYPSGIVHLDGSGDLMRVEFERPATPEFAGVSPE